MTAEPSHGEAAAEDGLGLLEARHSGGDLQSQIEREEALADPAHRRQHAGRSQRNGTPAQPLQRFGLAGIAIGRPVCDPDLELADLLDRVLRVRDVPFRPAAGDHLRHFPAGLIDGVAGERQPLGGGENFLVRPATGDPVAGEANQVVVPVIAGADGGEAGFHRDAVELGADLQIRFRRRGWFRTIRGNLRRLRRRRRLAAETPVANWP